MPKFVGLDERLRRPVPADPAPFPAATVPEAVPSPCDAPFFSELALLRLATVESYERLTARMLDALATEVLGRELQLAPADRCAIARRVLQEFTSEEPVRVLVGEHGAMLPNVSVPVSIDPALGPYDVVVVVRDGTIDARFDARRAAVLDACTENGR